VAISYSAGRHPFADGRVELYGLEFLRDHLDIRAGNRAALERIFGLYGVKWTLLDPASPANELLDSMPGWRIAYVDRFAVVHIHTSSALKSLADPAT
jgi:hypothetical protein